MPIHTATALTGKTLHQRSKSITTINSKRVLGETNTNLKVAPKDDSEIGKASPGKIRIGEEPQIPAQAFQRPAVRPLGVKSASSQNVPLKSQQMPTTGENPVKKIVAKKSKVLRDTLPASAQQEGIAKESNTVPASDTVAAPSQPVAALKQNTSVQEVHRVENVPLRDEPVARPQAQPAQVNNSYGVPLPTIPQAQYPYAYQPVHAPVPTTAHIAPATTVPQVQLATPPTDQYIEDDFDDEDQDYMTAQSFDLRGELTETTIFNPQHGKKHKQELADAKVWVEANRTAEDIEDEQWDTSMVAEYGDDIFEYMRDMETRMSPNPYYMEQQTEIQWSMRGVLMDWVVQVHQRFNLLPETLFLTINYIDRFLSCKIVSLGKLQLVGATAIFVAAKYEEVNCPTIQEIIYMVDNGYTAEELLKAERFMLSMLQFELGWPGPMSFLRRISKADDYDLETRTLAKYFLEVTIMDERFVGCKPSFLAAGAHCMARLMLRKGDWTTAHVYYSNYTFRQLHRLLGAIFECCLDGQTHHGAVFDKYTDKRYKRASTFVRGEIVRGFKLPFNYRSSSMGPQNTTGNMPMQ
ncbi:hypothetical protein M409DRAFT_21653 [Zasmidium cellare ATCC 36951]|uniref:Uncharacterized protein n=1 Tax=Zasmidium cellare ATCC 36951 TaxID=1080233 RepID=A0A6A6CR06_ZASCE|nr:uncharacterized protein M409DRAFT_21653 [Zasmidium cellare ATCC 36951]KAF2168209.1 hypothetical protein M409DRAFT_21653 [Zasmidium cellare ATCC 36951]